MTTFPSRSQCLSHGGNIGGIWLELETPQVAEQIFSILGTVSERGATLFSVFTSFTALREGEREGQTNYGYYAHTHTHTHINPC
jgi:hypothetical protein